MTKCFTDGVYCWGKLAFMLFLFFSPLDFSFVFSSSRDLDSHITVGQLSIVSRDSSFVCICGICLSLGFCYVYNY